MEKKAGATFPKQGSKAALGKKANLRDMRESELQADFKQAVIEKLRALSPGEAYQMWKREELSLVHFCYLSLGARLLIVDAIDSANIPSSLLADLASDPEEWVRKAVAKNQNTSIATLKILAKDTTKGVRKVVVSNPNISTELLTVLAKDRDKWVRRNVANNTNTPEASLKVLAGDEAIDVRKAVAMNQNTSVELLLVLAEDEVGSVRECVARNDNTPALLKLSLLTEHGCGDEPVSIAKNPSTSETILMQLANDGDYFICVDVATNINCSSSTLETLSIYEDEEVRCGVAKNPKTSKPVLQILAGDKHKKVRSAVVLNPQCPTELLIELCHDTSISMQAKDVAIKKLNFSEDILSLSHFHSVLQTKPIPEHVLVSLGQHVNSEVRLAALSNTLHPNWMKSLIEVPKKNPLFLRWVSDAESTVKSAVESDNVFFFVGKDANEAALATSALARVFAISDGASVEPTRLDESQEHSDWLVRMSIASNIGTPTNLLNRLKQDSHALVAKQAEITIAKLSDKPEMEMLDKEKRQSCFYELSKVVAAAIKSKHQMVAPDDTVWGYCMHPEVLWDPSRINEVTKTWSKDEWHLFGAWILPLEPEALAPYLTSESIVAFAVKYLKRKKLSLAYLASHPFCSEVSLKLLAEDKNNNVCCAVAKNPNTLSASLKLLAELKGGGRVLINNIAGNPNTPDVILDKLAKDKDEDVRKAVAANPNTSMASLKLLAREEDKWIRFAVACNLNTSIALLTLLAEDEMSLTRKAVAENPNTPVHLLTQLAQDKDEWVRRNVAENPNTPVMLLKLLAKDEDYLVLRGVARNPNTPKASLALLARDKNEYIRKAVADNGKVPAVKLETTSSNKYAFLQSLSLAEYKEYIRFALSPDIILPADITTLDIRRGVESLGLLREEISYEELTEMRISKDRLQRVAVCFHNNVTENFLAILSQDKDLAVAEIAKEMYADLFENIPILKK